MALGFQDKFEQQQTPSFFARGPSAFARLIFFTTLSIVLMVIDGRLHYLSGVRQTLMTMLHPLQVIADFPVDLYRNADEYFSTHTHLLSENAQLKQQTLQQSITLQKLNTLTLENIHLRQLLQTNQSLAEQSVLGEIMYVGRDIFSKKIIVNRGQKHEIVAGEAVVDANGVIGQVTRVFPLSSEVTLITDKSLAIPVQIERNGLRAIAFGRGKDNTLDLPYLPTSVDIQRGDKLVTSGIDSVYPAGLLVATVKQIDSSPDSPFARIICTPTGETENHRQVLLVKTSTLETNASHAITNGKLPFEQTSSFKPLPATNQFSKPNNATALPKNSSSIKTGLYHAAE
ncbi:MAG: rod shape-determining protein MreC [Methylophilaceae bacterium]